MTEGILVQIGADALDCLVDFAQQKGWEHFTLVADERTQAAFGATVQDRLARAGKTTTPVILAGCEVVADEHSLVQVLVHADPESDAYLAVGAGTITDIVRFVSDRNRRPFVSVPTAPSVDGFTSAGAPLIIGGVKQTIQVQPPLAVFADLPTLCAAPRPMIAAGLGDMLGKYTSLADWQLGQLLWHEPYSEPIARRTKRALRNCVERVEEISQASGEGISTLMDGLIESGLCIAEAGHSRAASGAEHHISHYWEMKLLQLGRPAILHGAKVGVASLAIAELYRQIREMSPHEVEERLDAHCRPSPEHERRRISQAFGRMGAEIAAENGHFIDMTNARYDDLRQRIATHWPRIQQIATTVPAAETLEGWLRQAGGPVSLSDLGMTDEDLQEALQYAHYLRDRFTVLKLAHVLGMIPGDCSQGEGAVR